MVDFKKSLFSHRSLNVTCIFLARTNKVVRGFTADFCIVYICLRWTNWWSVCISVCSGNVCSASCVDLSSVRKADLIPATEPGNCCCWTRLRFSFFTLPLWYGGQRHVGRILQPSSSEDSHLQDHRDRRLGRREDLSHLPLLCRQVPREDRGHDRGGLQGEAGGHRRGENQGVYSAKHAEINKV